MTATADRTLPKADAAAIEQALRLILQPGQVTELRILDAVTAQDRRPHTISGYFDYDHLADLARAAASVQSAKGVYFIPNPIKPALLARARNRARNPGKDPTTADHDIERRLWLMIDCDPERPAGISATDGEHQAAIERACQIRDFLASLGWNAPIMADSGNGAHLLYRIDLPANDGGLVQRCLEALDVRFSGDGVNVDTTVFNPARIWKLYGTVAGKGDDTPDRPHRASRVLETPDDLFSVPGDLLEALAAKAPKPAAPEWAPTGNGDRYKQFDLESWAREHSLDLGPFGAWQGSGKKAIFNACPFNPDHVDRSAILAQRPDGKFVFRCMHNSCTSYHWPDLRELVEPGFRDRKASYQGNGRASVNGHAAPYVKPASERHKPVYEWLSCPELMAGDFRQNYLVEDIVTEAQGGIISGRFKTLKTTVAVDLFISMATGAPFLGRFNVPQPIPCGMMTAESGLATIQETCRRVAAGKNIDLRSIGNLHLSPSCPRMARDEHVEEIERTIAERGLKCLAIDPTYLAFSDVGDSSSNVFKMGAALEPITGVIRRTGCSIIFLNHNIKGRARDLGRFDPPELAEISMSGFAEWMRFWILLGPRHDWDELTGRHWLWMRTGGSAGHAGLWGLDVVEGRRSDDGGRRWQPAVVPATETRQNDEFQRESSREAQKEFKTAEAAKKIRDFLFKRKAEGATKTQIKDSLAMNSKTFGPALAQMELAGQVKKVSIKKGNNRRYDAYILAGMADE